MSLRRATPRLLLAAAAALLILSPARAPGTVAEQRARLPPPAECASPVEGVWKALVWSAGLGSWYEFTLEIHREPGSDTGLTGAIRVHGFEGSPDRPEPGPCVGLRFRGTMNARGWFRGGVVHFEGLDWHLDEVICGEWDTSYNVDTFEGKIDPRLQEFQSIHNDGHMAVDEATVFRRISCFEEKPRADVAMTPPPYYPERHGGCSCSVGL